MSLLVTEALCRRYGSLVAVDRVDLRVRAGARHALIGPNGAGKTTLLDLLAGATRADAGRVRFDGRDITGWGPARRARFGIGRTHQRPAVWPSLTALENVLVASRRCGGGWPRWRWSAADRRDGAALLDRIGLPGADAAEAARLSHGQRRQLEIAMALAGRPRLLLLDEPAAGLAAGELDRLGAVLAELPRTVTVLLVEHRLDLVFAVADEVTVLRDGRPVATGTPGRAGGLDAVRRAYAEAAR